MEIYGNDPQEPSPTERDNHVVIDPVDLSHGDLLKSFVFEHLDPLRPSTEMGADIYTEALELVFQRLKQLSDSEIYMPQQYRSYSVIRRTVFFKKFLISTKNYRQSLGASYRRIFSQNNFFLSQLRVRFQANKMTHTH